MMKKSGYNKKKIQYVQLKIKEILTTSTPRNSQIIFSLESKTDSSSDDSNLIYFTWPQIAKSGQEYKFEIYFQFGKQIISKYC